jgi:hypothetical protein
MCHQKPELEAIVNEYDPDQELSIRLALADYAF